MKFLFMVTLLLVGVAAAEPVAWGDSYYEFIDPEVELTWTMANDFAQATYFAGAQGRLVVITSEDENRFLSEYAEQFLHAGTASAGWIGLSQLPEGYEPHLGWTWVTGEPLLVYENWAVGHPNEQWPNRPSDWAVMIFTGTFNAWWSVPDEPNNNWGYFVEWDAAAVAARQMSWGDLKSLFRLRE